MRYNRPFKDPLLDHYTLDELLIEYLTISFAESPEELRKAKLEVTGDPDTDELWYNQVAPDSKTPEEIDEEFEIG